MSATEPEKPNDVTAKGKEFFDKAKAGQLDEKNLKWGLSAGAVVAGVSLLLPYVSYSGFVSFSVTGLDLLRFREISLKNIEALAIPLTALYGLYLHFGEPSLKLLKLETPGRAKTVYLIGAIVAALGVVGCLRILSHQVCLGSVLGLVGLAVLAFVYFKLWKASPAATSQPPLPPPSAGA